MQDNVGNMIYEPLNKAEILANSFYERFRPCTQSSDDNFAMNVTQQVKQIITRPPSKIIPHVGPKEVKIIIKNLPNNKAPGPDSICTEALKRLPNRALTHITKIFNLCLRYHYFPLTWKTAHIIAIPKPGKDPINPHNYRPISLLNFLSKIFERLILNRLSPILNSPERINHFQFGFKSLHSTTDALFRLTFLYNMAFNNIAIQLLPFWTLNRRLIRYGTMV